MIKYLEDGCKVNVIKITKKGYIVTYIFDDCCDAEKYNYFFVLEVFDDPPKKITGKDRRIK